MAKANYREIGGPSGLLAKRKPFKGNSMSAEKLSDGTYMVYSWATEIARINPDGTKVLNDRRYSVTTTRQQNLCRAWL